MHCTLASKLRKRCKLPHTSSHYLVRYPQYTKLSYFFNILLSVFIYPFSCLYLHEDKNNILNFLTFFHWFGLHVLFFFFFKNRTAHPGARLLIPYRTGQQSGMLDPLVSYRKKYRPYRHRTGEIRLYRPVIGYRTET